MRFLARPAVGLLALVTLLGLSFALSSPPALSQVGAPTATATRPRSSPTVTPTPRPGQPRVTAPAPVRRPKVTQAPAPNSQVPRKSLARRHHPSPPNLLRPRTNAEKQFRAAPAPAVGPSGARTNRGNLPARPRVLADGIWNPLLVPPEARAAHSAV